MRVGLDVGGTNTKLVAVDPSGQALWRARIERSRVLGEMP